mmetsp:Transcript_9648/g.22573  ORF Transcript_9648/g.22573 Transcript_9648/m.22573 type:complete len:245 (-) Transcript_9648:384-1118(-)
MPCLKRRWPGRWSGKMKSCAARACTSGCCSPQPVRISSSQTGMTLPMTAATRTRRACLGARRSTRDSTSAASQAELLWLSAGPSPVSAAAWQSSSMNNGLPPAWRCTSAAMKGSICGSSCCTACAASISLSGGSSMSWAGWSRATGSSLTGRLAVSSSSGRPWAVAAARSRCSRRSEASSAHCRSSMQTSCGVCRARASSRASSASARWPGALCWAAKSSGGASSRPSKPRSICRKGCSGSALR